MSAIDRYIENVEFLIKKLKSDSSSLELAAQLIAKSINSGGLVHVFGTGHSHMLAEEMFYRAGGLGAVNPILEEDLMLHVSASKSTELERRAELAEEILRKQSLSANDVFIIISNSGGNSLIEAMARRIQKMNIPIIAITSINHATSPEARTSGTKLHELADIVLDNLGAVGDASVRFSGSDIATGPTSSVIGATMLNAISSRVVEISLEQGVEPEVFSSSNTQIGDKKNQELVTRLQERIKIL